jgi:hypothetical protein
MVWLTMALALKAINELLVVALRHNSTQPLCNICGNPNNLKTCTSCGVRKYCSKKCMKKDGRMGHRQECKRIKMQLQDMQVLWW